MLHSIEMNAGAVKLHSMEKNARAVMLYSMEMNAGATGMRENVSWREQFASSLLAVAKGGQQAWIEGSRGYL
jgi:hypothetical protein